MTMSVIGGSNVLRSDIVQYFVTSLIAPMPKGSNKATMWSYSGFWNRAVSTK